VTLKLPLVLEIALPKSTKCKSLSVSAHFRAVRDAVGMHWLHFHDLRHSAASEMINSGVDLYTVGAVLGHKSAQSIKRYAHLATASLSDAIGKIGRKVTDSKKKRPAGNPRKAA